MTRLAGAAFAALVVATVAAFFVAQRLKAAPAVIGQIRRTPFFSPNRDGRFDRATIRFELRRRDRVTVAILSDEGDQVRELIDARRYEAYDNIRARWDGRGQDGRRVPDGVYRYRITLQGQGRTVVVPRPVRVDTTPPHPRVTSIGPERVPAPELLPLPGGGAAEVHLFAPGRRKRILLFKMAPGPPRVARVEPLRDDASSWRWDARTDTGRPVSPGTYLVVVETRDMVGNIGTSVPLDRRGLPVAGYGARLPGRGGITVRYLGVQPPLRPVRAGRRLEFRVDARQRPWRWSVRRLGSPEVVRRGRKTTERLRLRAPGRESGVYLLEVRTAGRAVRAPFAVQGAARGRVLVVLPAMTWQGRNPVDDDGDGLPDLLDRGLSAKLGRVLAGDGLPAGFARREGPLLAWLARRGARYDVTTDVALTGGEGPPLDGHRGVLLPGDARWLPRAVQERLRDFVRRGGTLVSLGVDSLRRQVALTPDGRLVDPTPPATTDIFGARLGPLQRRSDPIALTAATDEIELFAGTAGQFAGWRAFEPTLRPGGRIAASAVTAAGQPVIVATRLGRGLVVRFGLPEMPVKLSADDLVAQATALMERTWTLLSR